MLLANPLHYYEKQDSFSHRTHFPRHAEFTYGCTGAVKITNTGNVRLTAITPTGAVTASSCSPSLTDLQLSAGANVICNVEHATTLPEFEAGKLSLSVTATATALGGTGSISNGSSTVEVTLPKRRTATLELIATPSANPVTAIGTYIIGQIKYALGTLLLCASTHVLKQYVPASGPHLTWRSSKSACVAHTSVYVQGSLACCYVVFHSVLSCSRREVLAEAFSFHICRHHTIEPGVFRSLQTSHGSALYPAAVGAYVDFTATLINTGNIELVGAKVVLTHVPSLTCLSGTAGATPATQYGNTGDNTNIVPYGHKVVCTARYTFDQASYEALTTASMLFSASVENTVATPSWTTTPAANAQIQQSISATAQPTATVTFQSESCVKPNSSFGESCTREVVGVWCGHASGYGTDLLRVSPLPELQLHNTFYFTIQFNFLYNMLSKLILTTPVPSY